MNKSYQQISRVLKLIWLCSKKWTIIQFILLLTQSLLPLAALYTMKLLIDKITLQANTGAFDSNVVLIHILVLGGIYFLISMFGILGQFAKEAHQQLVADYMANIIQKQSLSLELAYYEQADFKDNFARAQQEALYRPSSLSSLGR